MTRVTITETYAVGCPDCTEQLIRLCQWSARDSQVTGLTFKAVPRCDHALPIQKGKIEKLLGSAVLRTAKPQSEQPITDQAEPPTPHPTLFAVGENRPSPMAGTGYDEGHVAG